MWFLSGGRMTRTKLRMRRRAVTGAQVESTTGERRARDAARLGIEPLVGRCPMNVLEAADPRVAELIAAESARQHDTLCLIPSENHVSPAVLAASGSVLTNKYSEGYPAKRYYKG